MCGNSDFSIKNKDVSLYLGYYGSSLEVDKIKYDQEEKRDEGTNSREEMKDCLFKNFTKKDLVEIMLKFVDNGEEG